MLRGIAQFKSKLNYSLTLSTALTSSYSVCKNERMYCGIIELGENQQKKSLRSALQSSYDEYKSVFLLF